MYKIVYIVWKIVYFEYSKLYTFFENFLILNIQNGVHYLKICVL